MQACVRQYIERVQLVNNESFSDVGTPPGIDHDNDLHSCLGIREPA